MPALAEMTLPEKEACAELKRRVSNEITGDLKNDTFMYLRFLRARDFDMDLAEKMLRNHIAWRTANQIDSILTTYVPEEVVIKHLPLTRIGFDKEGAIIRFFDFGATDCKGILKSCKSSAVIKTLVSMFEEDVVVMKKQREKLGKNIQQWVYIFDFEDYSFAKATHKQTVETLLQIFMTYDTNYPERLKAAYMINASFYFSLIFAVIKPVLSRNTMNKVYIYGKDGWKEDLLKAIDPEVLPKYYGGTRTDPDENPKCCSEIKYATMVPKEFYMTKRSRRLKDQPGVKRFVVSRMSKVNLEMNVEEDGSTIEWEFETESRDIGFGLLYKDWTNDKAEFVELIPRQRTDTHLTSEVGTFFCDKAGKYILMFDNSYSWIYQKEIYCKTEVIVPRKTIREDCE